MVPTTLQNLFSLTFLDKMKCFPWLICSCEIPMSAFSCLQSHLKQGQRKKF